MGALYYEPKKKMVLISSTLNDYSTNDVIDWFQKADQEIQFIRLNPEDLISNLKIDLANSDGGIFVGIEINKKELSISNISSFWYRRGEFSCTHNAFELRNRQDLDIKNYLNKEWDVVSDFISNRLLEKKKLGDIKDNKLNKLEVLAKAKRLGIDIPKTIITTNPIEGSRELIAKSMYNGGFTIEEKYSVGTFTQLVTTDSQDNFFPSLFQEKIEKLYELRIFYFDQIFYPSAIFSQGNKKTEIDFRDYDKEKPNRVVPFKLPSSIEVKLTTLMDELKLETGSIDMIVTPDKKYVFLEVNPIGQFNQVSVPCNYNLEEKIANYLLNEQD